MSRWTHACCALCFVGLYPNRDPVRVVGIEPETCCFCEAEAVDGIYVRADPATVRCGGHHPGDGE
jgi:hypothetical protein